MTLNQYLLKKGYNNLPPKTESDLGVIVGDKFRELNPGISIPRVRAHIPHRQLNDYPVEFLESCEGIILSYLQTFSIH